MQVGEGCGAIFKDSMVLFATLAYAMVSSSCMEGHPCKSCMMHHAGASSVKTRHTAAAAEGGEAEDVEAVVTALKVGDVCH
jgi:hypothetical protein